ncbi:MAG TPA: glycosyltransferase [Candidatus Saccharimonadales bacterium]|nr:glycosyltransferase [Candidatus Saccharimonadales bacterium]
MSKKICVNIVSESDISVQGHGVHTAYIEMVNALKKQPDVTVTTGRFGEQLSCDIVHLHTVGLKTWSKLRQKGPKKVISAHVVPDSFVGSLILAKYWRFAAVWYLKWFYNQADLLLAVSQQTKQDLLAIGVTAPIEVLYNFIDTTRYKTPAISQSDVRKKLHIPNDSFVVIGAGQVQPRKRIDSFFAAAKTLPDVYFVWVGGMPFGKVAADNVHMEEMIQSAPKNVIFTGIVQLDEMVSYYHAADMFWLPSEQETFGLVVVEAAAAGLPVMLRDIPDYQDTFGTNALVGVTNDDFCTYITTLRSDPSILKQWKQKSKRIAKQFDSKLAAARLVEMYRQLL